MIIHTFVYNQNKINLPECKYSYRIWNYNLLKDLIKRKYSDWEIYFKRLILNKSRENLIKYVLLHEFGGIFINIELLKLFTPNNMETIYYIINSKYDMYFCMDINFDKNEKDFTMNIFDVDEFVLNDDIIVIKNNSNSFIKKLLMNIDKTKIPINEYQNKIYLGNIFLSNQLNNFYKNELNIRLTNRHSFFNFGIDVLESKYKNDSTNKFEKSIYFIELRSYFPFDNNYKLKTYPNVPDLTNPEPIIDYWNNIYRIKNYIENTLIFVIYQNNSFIITMVVICLIVIFNYYLKEYFKSILDIKIKPAQIDSKIFFNTKKFKFLKQLQKSWKIIRDEALIVASNSPKLNISRTINDWHDSMAYFETIKDKHGWIRSWSYESVNESVNECEYKHEHDHNHKHEHNYGEKINKQTQEGNYEWLNYGLLYFDKEFTENVKQCPKTFELVNEIRKEINICGFSWMFGGSVLQPHTDITGLSSGTLAMHLGLSVPKPDNTCRLIIKNEDGEYMYMNEENGKMFVFDATWEHYAYNLSNRDRLILYIDFTTF